MPPHAFRALMGIEQDTWKGGSAEHGREPANVCEAHSPLMELQSRPEPHVLSIGSETPLQRPVGEFGAEVGELGVDGPSRSASMVEPGQYNKDMWFLKKLVPM